MKKGAYGDASGDTGFRRKFSAADYAEKKEETDAIMEVANVRPDEINFESVVNKVQVYSIDDISVLLFLFEVVQTTVKSVGFTCKLCRRVFKDNLIFLEHLTSKEHLLKLGVDSTKKATLEEVKEKMEQLRKNHLGREKLENEDPVELLKSRIKKREEELQEKKMLKKKLRLERRQQDATISGIEEKDEEMMKMMGFSGKMSSLGLFISALIIFYATVYGAMAHPQSQKLLSTTNAHANFKVPETYSFSYRYGSNKFRQVVEAGRRFRYARDSGTKDPLSHVAIFDKDTVRMFGANPFSGAIECFKYPSDFYLPSLLKDYSYLQTEMRFGTMVHGFMSDRDSQTIKYFDIFSGDLVGLSYIENSRRIYQEITDFTRDIKDQDFHLPADDEIPCEDGESKSSFQPFDPII